MENLGLTSRVYLPKSGANDVSGVVRRWLKESGSKVTHGDHLGEIETSKALVDVDADADGWFYPLVAVDDSAVVGSVIAVIADRPDLDLAALENLTREHSPESPQAKGGDSGVQWTRKATILIERHGLDKDQVAASARPDPNKVTEADVLAFVAKPQRTVQPVVTGRRVQRVLVIGSAAGGGAAIVIDSLARIPEQVAVGVVDSNAALHGSYVLGVPVLGSSDVASIVRMYEEEAFDAAVIAFNRDIEARSAVFLELRERGVPFTNVIDPTVNIRNLVAFGAGNVILGSSYLGAESIIGDNNFLSSNTCIEHHCRLGSHNAFGPAVAFSGNVTIGDRIRFGTQIAIEPGVTIGSDSVIASSCVITSDVPARSLLRAKTTFTVSPRPETKILSSYTL